MYVSMYVFIYIIGKYIKRYIYNICLDVCYILLKTTILKKRAVLADIMCTIKKNN